MTPSLDVTHPGRAASGENWGQQTQRPEKIRIEIENLLRRQIAEYEKILTWKRNQATPEFALHHVPAEIDLRWGPTLGAWELETGPSLPQVGIRRTEAFREGINQEGDSFRAVLDDFAAEVASKLGTKAVLDHQAPREQNSLSKYVIRLHLPDDSDKQFEVWDELSEELTQRFQDHGLMDQRNRVYINLRERPGRNANR